jgi:hypothetical protein
MTDKELKESYDELSFGEFAEAIDDIEQVERVLGKGVAEDVNSWIYLHIK